MIVSKQKPFDQVLDALSKYQKIFLIGCSLCADLCRCGGEKEVIELKGDLVASGKDVIGYKVVDAACHFLETKKELKDAQSDLRRVEAVLSLACGAGSQILASFIERPVFTAVDTLFLGTVERWGRFDTLWHRKRQTGGLSRTMIGVLSYDDHLHLVKGRRLQSVEHPIWWRVDGGVLPDLVHFCD